METEVEIGDGKRLRKQEVEISAFSTAVDGSAEKISRTGSAVCLWGESVEKK